MKKEIKTDNAPGAIGPYSQGILAGDYLFVSGQIAINPANGKMDSYSIENETERVLNNIKGIVEEAGSNLDSIVKVTLYLTDIRKFHIVNRIYKRFFSKNPPARSTAEVTELPKGAHVEIDAIAMPG